MTFNKTMAGYFTSHPNVNEFWFCSDGLAFFNEATAQQHAAALKSIGKSDVITAVTRADAAAWWATYVPEYAAECAANLDAARSALTDAEAALAALPVKTDVSRKASFIKAVNDARAKVTAAEAALEAANADAQQLADKTVLTNAEHKLKADAATDGIAAAVLEADKAAVDAATTAVEKDKKNNRKAQS
jgi:colicin import membrane protein